MQLYAAIDLHSNNSVICGDPCRGTYGVLSAIDQRPERDCRRASKLPRRVAGRGRRVHVQLLTGTGWSMATVRGALLIY